MGLIVRSAIDSRQRERAEKPASTRLPICEEFNAFASRMLAKGTDKRSADYEANLRDARANEIIRGMNVPKHYRDSTLTKPFDPPEHFGRMKPAWTDAHTRAYNDVRQRLTAFIATYGIVALLGSRATGKTQFGWGALIDAARKHQKTGRYIKAADLFIDIEGTWARNPSEKTANLRTLLDRLIRPDILVIDELSEMQADRDWQSGRMTYLIDRRYDENRATILISNDKTETFTRNLGESSMSRLGERGKIYVCDWPPHFRG